MEAMRVLIDKDPLAEGLFTTYSSSLERVALRKARYLEEEPLAPDAPAPQRDTAPLTSSSAPPPAPAPANSVFASKLQVALTDDRE
jgi:hypothetical protein